MNEVARELEHYEYMVISTPRYTEYIEEGWKIVNVFIKYLDSGYVNYVLIFRRIKPASTEHTQEWNG